MDAFNEKTIFNGNGGSLKNQDQSHPALVHPGILQTTIIHEQERPDNHNHRDHDNKNKIDDDVLRSSNHYQYDHHNKNMMMMIDVVLRDHLGSEGRKTLRTARFSSGSLQCVGFSRSFIALKLLRKE